ncbi:A-kinase anchor protein 7 isoform X4 [Oncorhynchus kisutch]|uniref:A-kinase anchoring protein 7 n=2 Tax=Oncorhynchus kisutch TaxID=8019 RepID=A0A8C7IW75_ONCKI|nr:A-kinase anchoring protein 7 isoform X4 [Oncorhynchus kisutch]
MLGPQFFKSLRGICLLQRVLVAENINVRTAQGASLNLIKARQNSCYVSVLPQGQVNFIEMQPVTGTDYAVELETNSIEHGNDHLLSPAHGASTDPVAAESHLHCNVKELIAPEHEIVKRIKKRPKKPRGRKQKSKSSERSDNLMSELPFASTAIWKDLGFTKPEAKLKNKRKRGASGWVESEEDADTKKKKKETQRPNYFVSIPITNPKISEGVGVVQALVMQRDSRLTRALVPVGSLHITLLVTHLASQEEVNLAVCAVAQMKAALRDLLRGRELILPFHGIGHFRNEVAFVELAQGEHLATLAQITAVVRKTFEEKGLSSGDGKAFKPHLTFMKLSKAPKLRSQGVKKLDPELYSDYAQHHFGDERVIRLDLCSMLKKKTPDGYYHQEASVTFGVKRGPEPDDEELVSLSKRLVEDAVLRAVQQYMDETQHNGAASSDLARPSDNLNSNTVNTTTTDTSASSK